VLSWRYQKSLLVILFLSVWLVIWWSFIFAFTSALHGGSREQVEFTRFEFWLERLISLDWWIALFPIPLAHIVVGLLVAYVILAQIINRTILSFDRSRVNVSHRPLPWRSPPSLAMSEIASFSTLRYTVRRRKGGRSVYHAVVAELLDDKQIKLVKMRHSDAASEIQYLVQELNNAREGRWGMPNAVSKQ